jgi:uncharacterized protein (TIGR02231 family)
MTTIDSAIVEVAVFPDRARVTRRGSVTLEAGTHQIEFAGVPTTLLPDSIRAAGKGTAQALLLGVDARRVYFSETPAVPIKDLEQQIDDLTNQDKAFADQAAAANVQIGFIKSLADKSAEQIARGLAFGRMEMNQGDALLAFMQRQMDQAQAAIRDVDAKRKEIARQLTKLNNDLNARRSAQPRERFSAFVEVEIKQAGDLELDLTYVVNQAGWAALYDLRYMVAPATIDEQPSPSIQFAYLGQITQRTGEDWDDVTLTLSTARPSLTTIQPELQPWYINAYVPMPVAAPAAPARAAGLVKTAVAGELAAVPAPQAMPAPQAFAMEAPPAEVSREGASVTFTLKQTASIPSDGSPHKVTVATIDLAPKIDYIAVPKLAEAAYRRATITNRSDYVLLAGQANLFVSGDYIGATHIDRVAPNEEFELALGVDDGIVIQRELKARDVDKKLIGDKRRLHFAYEIEIRNLHNGKIDLEVHDQFPVSRHEQIKVKLEAADPKPREQTELNELEWQLSLAPNAKQIVRFDFTVEHPVTMQVMGLP